MKIIFSNYSVEFNKDNFIEKNNYNPKRTISITNEYDPNKTVENNNNFSSKTFEIIDYNNKREFKNHILKSLYNKEGGQIINFLKKTNDNLKSENESIIKTDYVSKSIKKENSFKTKSVNFKDQTLKNELGITNKTTDLCLNSSKNINCNIKLTEYNPKSRQNSNLITKANYLKGNVNQHSTSKFSVNQTQTQNDNIGSKRSQIILNKFKKDNENFKITNTTNFSYIPNKYLNKHQCISNLNKDLSNKNNESNKINKEETNDNHQENINIKPIKKQQSNRVLLNNKSKKNHEIKNNLFISQVLLSENCDDAVEKYEIKNAHAVNYSPYKTDYYKGFDYSVLKRINDSKKFDETNKFFSQTKTDGLSDRRKDLSLKDLKKDVKNNINKEAKLEEKFMPNITLENRSLDRNNNKGFKTDFFSKLKNKSSRNFNEKSTEVSKRKETFEQSNSLILNENQRKEKLIEKVLSKRKDIYYCPNCDHCNSITDENLDKHFVMNEAKNIIKRSFDYIAKNFETKQNYLDFLLQKNPNEKDTDILFDHVDKKDDPNHIGLAEQKTKNFTSLNNSNKNNNLNSNAKSKEKINLHESNHNSNNYNNNKTPIQSEFSVGNLLKSFPHQNNDRSVIKIVTHFLDALINDKASIDSIASDETLNKLKEILIAQGISFIEANGELDFDKELDLMFDNETKEKLKKLFKSKF